MGGRLLFKVAGTGHLLYASKGEADLVELLKKYQDRIGTFHFKVNMRGLVIIVLVSRI